MANDRELIVMATPIYGDPYYADAAEDIIDFQIGLAKAAAGHDHVLILSDPAWMDAFQDLPEEAKAIPFAIEDIWTRDFGSSNPAQPLIFRYTSEGQGGGKKGQTDADAVQEGLLETIEDAGLTFLETDLLNDGGNFVEDGDGRAVTSRKFLRDNGLTESQGRQALKDLLGLTHIAFIESDEQGGLEHADGVVAFIAPNTAVINDYSDDPAYAQALEDDLKAGLPGVTIHKIVQAYDDDIIHDERFGSACGLYTNMLVTPNRIYLPQFGIKEDKQAFQSLQAWTDKTIIPVQSGQICHMGGGVRCMTWQLRGQNAKRLWAWASTQ